MPDREPFRAWANFESEEARKRYALLQTPEFVEAFILDRTLEPAIETFGLAEARLIDPTCGSGHFLLAAFWHLVDRWGHTEPATVERELVQRALDAVVGVDVNPFAVAIARFCLLVAALRAAALPPWGRRQGFASMWRWVIACCTAGASTSSISRARSYATVRRRAADTPIGPRT